MLIKLFRRRSTAGFTLIELLSVIVIVGVLASIAAPGWLTFMNSRRANAARDQILQTLRQAQASAIRSKQTQTIKFNNTTADPPTMTAMGMTQPLGEGQFKSQMIGLTIIGISSKADGCSDTNCIAFDANGSIRNSIPNDGIKITVSAPPTNGSKRCVIVRTILGAVQPGSDSECS